MSFSVNLRRRGTRQSMSDVVSVKGPPPVYTPYAESDLRLEVGEGSSTGPNVVIDSEFSAYLLPDASTSSLPALPSHPHMEFTPQPRSAGAEPSIPPPLPPRPRQPSRGRSDPDPVRRSMYSLPPGAALPRPPMVFEQLVEGGDEVEITPGVDKNDPAEERRERDRGGAQSSRRRSAYARAQSMPSLVPGGPVVLRPPPVASSNASDVPSKSKSSPSLSVPASASAGPSSGSSSPSSSTASAGTLLKPKPRLSQTKLRARTSSQAQPQPDTNRRRGSVPIARPASQPSASAASSSRRLSELPPLPRVPSSPRENPQSPAALLKAAQARLPSKVAELTPTSCVSISRRESVRAPFAIDAGLRMPAAWMQWMPAPAQAERSPPNDSRRSRRATTANGSGNGGGETTGTWPRATGSRKKENEGEGGRVGTGATEERGDARKRVNLYLGVERGRIDVDVYLVGEPRSSAPHTRMEMLLEKPTLGRRNGQPLLARIHAPLSPRAPFYLMATARDGFLSLHIPRTFHGVLSFIVDKDGDFDAHDHSRLSTSATKRSTTHSDKYADLNKHVTLSSALTKRAFLFGETRATRSYFVRPLSTDAPSKGKGTGSPVESDVDLADDADNWMGDTVIARVEDGKARVQFEDEPDHDGWWRLW
ncbi:hypothetical protein HGRIS_012095 [Hohenbuehelia grisea]|uniref:DUF7330 domain-containing protein n=1 Tax=Hohenbuehelia grisea TaxID=104357 RepID=A0ABR3IRC4_9AGAR